MSLLEISQLKKSFIGPDGREQRVIDVRHFSRRQRPRSQFKAKAVPAKQLFSI
jgi:hypothetical protein